MIYAILAKLLRRWAVEEEVTGSIPDGIDEFFAFYLLIVLFFFIIDVWV